MKLSKLWPLIFSAGMPVAVAAPFCVVTATQRQCNYFDAESCKHAAEWQRGLCVANAGDATTQQPSGVLGDYIEDREEAQRLKMQQQQMELQQQQMQLQQQQMELQRQQMEFQRQQMELQRRQAEHEQELQREQIENQKLQNELLRRKLEGDQGSGAASETRSSTSDVTRSVSFDSWHADNSWFERDRARTEFAVLYAKELRQQRPDLSGRAFLDAVSAKVKETFDSSGPPSSK
jgi:septal ring factor EnvC (AmiA/AmiB activator)